MTAVMQFNLAMEEVGRHAPMSKFDMADAYKPGTDTILRNPSMRDLDIL